MPVFFIPSTVIQGKTVTLIDPLYTHLCKSLRVRTGQSLRIRNEHRQQHTIIINKISKNSLTGEIQDTLNGPPLEQSTITLVQAILKPDHMAWIIQKSTELGVNSIVPIITERVRSRSGKGSLQHYCERWQRIALEAAQQSERWNIPLILSPQPFTNFLRELTPTHRHFLLTEREGTSTDSPISFTHPIIADNNVVLATGPEGGWSQEEILKAKEAGFRKVSLGEKILRSETATITALVMLQERLKQLSLTTIS
mgnify:CR=1 FL=1